MRGKKGEKSFVIKHSAAVLPGQACQEINDCVGEPVAAGKSGMSFGDTVGWEKPSGQVGIPTTPGRAPRYFLSSNSKETWSKPLAGDLHSHPGSVPTGMAMESSELPGILVEWHTGNGKPSLGLKQCRSVCGPSALHASTGLRDPSSPGPVFAPSSMGSVWIGCFPRRR